MENQEKTNSPTETSVEAAPNLPPELAGITAEEWAEKYARLLAEFDNYRKRTREETARQAQAKKYDFIIDLLQVIDNFERALEMTREAQSDLAEGMRAIDRQMRDLLAAHDIVPLEALGQPFDPKLHEAIGTMADPNYAPGMVCAVTQRGWMRGKDVLRHARVLVSKEPEPSGPEEE